MAVAARAADARESVRRWLRLRDQRVAVSSVGYARAKSGWGAGARVLSHVLAARFLLCGLAATGCSTRIATSRAGSSQGRIVSVADGDTVTVRLESGATPTVRLLAVDSPEKYPTRYGSPDECGSPAASAFMEDFDGRRVVLVPDPGQDPVDTFGRLLRYVQLPGGKDLGGTEVARGLAMPYIFDTPARRYARYRSLAEEARAGDRGSWGPPCDGDFHSSVSGVQNGL